MSIFFKGIKEHNTNKNKKQEIIKVKVALNNLKNNTFTTLENNNQEEMKIHSSYREPITQQCDPYLPCYLKLQSD